MGRLNFRNMPAVLGYVTLAAVDNPYKGKLALKLEKLGPPEHRHIATDDFCDPDGRGSGGASSTHGGIVGAREITERAKSQNQRAAADESFAQPRLSGDSLDALDDLPGRRDVHFRSGFGLLFCLEYEDFSVRPTLLASCGDEKFSPRGHEKSSLRAPACWHRPYLLIMVGISLLEDLDQAGR
jgi:hypothetical protein